MARHARAPAELRVEEVLFGGAARFYDVGPEHPVWRDATHVLRWVPNLEGAFVRVEPPETASRWEVDAVRTTLLDTCGARVRLVLPRARPAVPEPEAAPAGAPPARARDVVMDLAADAPSRDTRALLELCAEICDEVGL